MSALLQQQLRGSNALVPFSTKQNVQKRVHRKRHSAVQASLFNFLSKPSPTKTPNRASELVDELFALTRNTNAGASFSKQKREEVGKLIEELAEYCPRQPLRSKLLFGTYEVLYAFSVDSTGGTLRSGAGPILFPGQKPSQILEEPNKIVNRLDFQTLGFLPGYGQQTGTFRPLNADTFELNLTQRQVNVGLGSEQVADISFVRKIQILYLDERCRVARFIPDPDPESSEPPREDAFFVFERVAEKQTEEPAEEAPTGTKAVSIFAPRGRQPGLATIAERKVREQLEADAQSSGKQRPAGRGTNIVKARPGSGTGIIKAKPVTTRGTANGTDPRAAKVDPRAAAAAKKRAEAEAARAKAKQEQEAAKAKAREEQERAKAKALEAEERAKREQEAKLAKERAEAERAAKQQRLVAVKEALSKLGAEIQEAQVASRAAKVELRDVDKETQATLRQTNAARAQLEAAIARTQSASDELQAAIDARNSAQADAKQAQADVKEAEKALREVAVAARR